MAAQKLGDVRGLITLLSPTDASVRLVSRTAGSLGRCRRVAPCLLLPRCHTRSFGQKGDEMWCLRQKGDGCSFYFHVTLFGPSRAFTAIHASRSLSGEKNASLQWSHLLGSILGGWLIDPPPSRSLYTPRGPGSLIQTDPLIVPVNLLGPP